MDEISSPEASGNPPRVKYRKSDKQREKEGYVGTSKSPKYIAVP